ncbi:MAG: S-layer homology domain-containing protein, partial [Clostridia bacterium]|nr:S-layer homology domain-containing protein [Clostridia bacterium]
MKKTAFITVFILVFSLMALSVSASYFSDVTDAKTVSAVEQLRMFGVIDGMGNGKFEPNGTLTRAQFCKMAVTALRENDSVSQYKNYTIFPDVRQNHWATGYVNLAVRSEKKFISGFPDGTFKPDTPITYGQAITILMRLLGYQDSDVGMVWPDGYINAAKDNGLTDGVTALGNASITRAQAAQLFANMLITNTKSGNKYISTVSGSVLDDVILLSNTARSSDGTENSLLTTTGIFKTADKPASADLLGEKGFLVLNEKGRALTFIPDKDAIRSKITLSSAASGHVIDEKGVKHIIPASTKTYYSGEETTWSSASTSIRKGSTVTVYYGSSGSANYVFAGGGYDKKTVVVSSDGSLREINTIVSSSDYVIYRNGSKAVSSDLCKYDVASYDEVNNKVEVSNLRITAVYEDAYPDFTRPEKITILGTQFDLLSQATNDALSFKAGDKITVLFTADGKIASVLNASQLSGNAKGVVASASGSSATVELTNGVKVSG